jgi:AraC-like DNA-binding protein
MSGVADEQHATAVPLRRVQPFDRPAMDLVVALKRGISSIAYDVGFGDLSYFNRVFRRQYNATPSDIRNDASR